MVTWNTDITASDTERYGEKASYLADLAANGFPTPTFFTVPVDTVHRFTPDNTAREEAEDWSAIQEAAAQMQDTIRSASLPESLAANITSAYTDIGLSKAVRNADTEAKDLVAQRDFEFVSVRPSTTSPVHGLVQPALCVNGKEDVKQAVKNQVAAVFSPDMLHFQHVNGETWLAVMVQRMIPAERSCSIHIGSSHVFVEAVHGFGNALSNGAVVPDRYIIDKAKGAVTEKTVSEQPWKHVQDPDTGRLTKQSVSKPGEPVLSRDTLEEAVSLARKAASTLPVNRVDLSFKRGKPHILDVKQVPSPRHPGETGETVEDAVHGVPAAPGTGSGITTHTPSNEDDPVLITDTLEPFHSPFFTRLTGVISTCGGVTANFADLCRVHNTPVIAGVPDALEKFPPGIRVMVDGDTGVVAEHEEEPVQTASLPAMEASPVLPATRIYVANPDNSLDVDGVYLSTQHELPDGYAPDTVWNAAGNGPGTPVIPAATAPPRHATGKPVLFQSLSAFQRLAMFHENNAAAFILDIPALTREAHDPSYVSQAVDHAISQGEGIEVAAILRTVDRERIYRCISSGVTTFIAAENILPRLQAVIRRAEQRFILDTVRRLRDTMRGEGTVT